MKRVILIIGAHMDDCENGAGGLIVKAVEKGHRVVLVNVVSDYTTWFVTRGREKWIRKQLIKKAKEMGVEKRFLDYGYQSVLPNMDTIKKLAEIMVDVKPDIALFPYRFETSPPDHQNVAIAAEHAVRGATRILSCDAVKSVGEMYAYQLYLRQSVPYPAFQPDTYIDISNEIKEVIANANYFDEKIYSPSKYGKTWAEPVLSRIKIDYLKGEELSLHIHGEMKLTTARFRGFQCGARYAEAYMALGKKVLGENVLQTII